MPVGLAASRKSGERARLWIDIPDARLPADRVAGSAGFVVVLFFMVGFGAALETPRHGVRRTVLALMGVLSTGVFWSCSGRSTQGGDGAAEDGGADGGATDGGATGPVSEDNFLQKVADALCGNVGACCTAAGIPYDRAGCEAFVFEEFERPPNSTWDAVAAEKCLEGFERLASSCLRGRD